MPEILTSRNGKLGTNFAESMKKGDEKLKEYISSVLDSIESYSANAERHLYAASVYSEADRSPFEDRSRSDETELKKHLENLFSDFPKKITNESKKNGEGNLFCDCKRSVIVFFIPGRKATAAYLGDWNNLDKAIERRIPNLHRDLIRRQFEPEDKSEFKHLFEFTHAFLDRNLKSDTPSTSFVIPNISVGEQAEENVMHFWTIHEDEKIIWAVHPSICKDFKDEMLLVTGVVATKEALVIQATYFSRTHDSTLSYNVLRYFQEEFSGRVLLRFYAPFLQFNTRSLEKALLVTNISGSFLRYSGRKLDEESAFSYSFKYNGTERCCADLTEVIYQNLIRKMSTIYETITKIEESIYKHLYSELNDVYSGLYKNLKGDGQPPAPPAAEILWAFPDQLRKRELVQEVEASQKALSIGTRDHVIHPFQTFLLGTILINESCDDFLKTVAEDFNLDVGNQDERTALKTFLKAAWFTCSTMHDIGYPIQVFDDLSDAMKKAIADLLGLRHLALPSTTLRIDDAIYCDPRAAWIMRRLAYGLCSIMWDKMPSEIKRHGWEFISDSIWWLINWFTFDKKRHDMASTLALAMMFLEHSTASIPVLRDFTIPTSPDGQAPTFHLTPIEKHILLPVMLHHVLDWADEIEKAKNRNHFANHAAKQLLESLGKIFKGCDHITGTISFEQQPLGVLLVICDLFQEWGRPGVKSKESYPSHIVGNINDSQGYPDLTVSLYYSNNEFVSLTPNPCVADYESRSPKVHRIDRLFDRGPLKNFEAKFAYSNIVGTEAIVLPKVGGE